MLPNYQLLSYFIQIRFKPRFGQTGSSRFKVDSMQNIFSIVIDILGNAEIPFVAKQSLIKM